MALSNGGGEQYAVNRQYRAGICSCETEVNVIAAVEPSEASNSHTEYRWHQ